MVVNKNIDINIDSYPISMAISIVPNIVDINIKIEISLTPGSCWVTTVCRVTHQNHFLSQSLLKNLYVCNNLQFWPI